jgi:hypothetical protein
MGRDTLLEALKSMADAPLVRAPGTTAEHESLAERLAAEEHANEELQARLRRYERERADIRSRLERILARLGRV